MTEQLKITFCYRDRTDQTNDLKIREKIFILLYDIFNSKKAQNNDNGSKQ